MFHQNEVYIAFEILLEEIEIVIEELNKKSEEALQNRDYEKAKFLIENAEKITNFREKIKDLQKEWETLFAAKIPRIKSKKIYSKLKKGLRTPMDAFRIPILESLIELGGRAPMKEVLEKVYEKMKTQLNEYDLSPLPSNPSQKRWENAVQWCRLNMVKEGLLSSDSPWGIWEISEKGRKFLEKVKIKL